MEYILMGLMYVGGMAVVALIMISFLEIIVARYKQELLILEQRHFEQSEDTPSEDTPNNVHYLKNEFTFTKHFKNKE